MDSSATANSVRFVVLDSWRGICALFVALHHFAVAGPVYSLALIQNANLFVDFFFVLSGFVITHAYGHSLSSVADARSFMIKRLGRVWPLHLTTLLFLISLEGVRALLDGADSDRLPFTGVDSWTTILPNAFLLHAFSILDGLSWNVPSWSISVEMGVYATFAIGLLVFRSKLPWFAMLAVTVSVIVLTNMPNPYVDATQNFGLFRGLAGFFLGYLVYWVRERQAAPGRATLKVATGMELVVIALVVLFVCTAGRGWLPLLAPFLFAVAIYQFSLEQGRLSRALALQPFVFLGRISYSIYMVHYPIVLIVSAICAFLSKRLGLHLVVVSQNKIAQKLLNFESDWADCFAMALFLSMTITAAALTFRFVERPGQDVVRHVLRAWRPYWLGHQSE